MSGGWSAWGAWGDCSRSCDTGVAFRTRQCDNPRPAYGGEPCHGDKEEFRLCNIESCPQVSDFRAEQCHNLFEIIALDSAAAFLGETLLSLITGDPGRTGLRSGGDLRSIQKWFPYEQENDDYKCKLTCMSRQSGEHYQVMNERQYYCILINLFQLLRISDW